MVLSNFTYENLNALRTRLSTRGSRRELQGREIGALTTWFDAIRQTPRSGEEIVRKMITDMELANGVLTSGLAKILLEMDSDASLAPSLHAIIQENKDRILQAARVGE